MEKEGWRLSNQIGARETAKKGKRAESEWCERERGSGGRPIDRLVTEAASQWTNPC